MYLHSEASPETLDNNPVPSFGKGLAELEDDVHGYQARCLGQAHGTPETMPGVGVPVEKRYVCAAAELKCI